MHNKVHTPFEVQIPESGIHPLEQRCEDPHVTGVTVLPSFKTKRNRLRNGRTLLRCDDTILTTDHLHPAYAEYQVGCGFLLWKLTSEASPDRIQSAFVSAFQDITGTLHRPGHPETTSADDLFSLLCSGAKGLESFVEDLYPAMEWEGASLYNDAVDEKAVRPLLRDDWISSLPDWLNRQQFRRLTGSHYLDVLKSSAADGEYYVLLHACGLQFSDLITPAAEQALEEKGLSNQAFMSIIQLMKHAATYRRAFLAATVLKQVSTHLPPFRCQALVDQTHHDVAIQPDGRVLYFNDSQRLMPDAHVILPSGFSNLPSYYIRTGTEVRLNPEGIPHNLKPLLKRDCHRKQHPESIRFCETRLPWRFTAFLQSPLQLDTFDLPLQTSAAADALVNTLTQHHEFESVTPLIPLFRFHIRRPGEKKCSRGVPA